MKLSKAEQDRQRYFEGEVKRWANILGIWAHYTWGFALDTSPDNSRGTAMASVSIHPERNEVKVTEYPALFDGEVDLSMCAVHEVIHVVQSPLTAYVESTAGFTEKEEEWYRRLIEVVVDRLATHIVQLSGE